jgi:hypothetical protein
MRHKVKHIGAVGLLLASLVLASLSCTQREVPMRTVGKSEAIELARKELLKQGLKVEDFRMTVETSSSGKDWLVFFDPKVQPKPGGGYWVTVDKVNGKAVFKVGD